MDKALGLLEVIGLSCAVEAADAMVKAADVTLVELEAARGNGMMTIKITGNVSAVSASIESGKAVAAMFGALVSADVIARPANDIGKVFLQDGQKERPVFFRAKELDETNKNAGAEGEETNLSAELVTKPESVEDNEQADKEEVPVPASEETQPGETAAETELPEEADLAVPAKTPNSAEGQEPAESGKAKPRQRQRRTRESKKSQVHTALPQESNE